MTVSDPFRLHAIKVALRRFQNRFFRLNGSPGEIARGFALGLLIGMTPFWGTHIILSLGFTSLFGWNRVAAVAGVNITNVFTAPLIYPITYWVGLKLTGFSNGARLPARLDWATLLDLFKESPRILGDMTTGGIVLGLPLAIAGYWVVLRGVRLYRQRSLARTVGHDRGERGCPAE